ncbi:MAG TPA: hypothetical protein ACFYD6_05475 [Candidatus Brocadiia bacterium]|nr:hypothetical protein [Planctomycetota bacterium]MDO8091938.1 hypothetical protein [Candidatus Brocadiales bacterium]
MKAKKALILAVGILVFSALVCHPLWSGFAYDGTKVRPNRLVFDKCKKGKKFTVDEDVYIKAKNLFHDVDVWVFIVENKLGTWNFGDPIGTDLADGPVTVHTTTKGKIPCTLIWENPLTAGFYDIVVDANCDGTYNSGDAVFDRIEERGLKVID